jgi:hypothetical protein
VHVVSRARPAASSSSPCDTLRRMQWLWIPPVSAMFSDGIRKIG